jgi:hypothetical protein
MINPFKLRGKVELRSFCNRVDERKILLADMQNSQSVLLYSPRRYGKTWLIKVVEDDLKDKGFCVVYIDLFAIYSRQHFIEKYTQKILNALRLPRQRIEKFSNEIFTGRSYRIFLAPSNEYRIEFSIPPDDLVRFEEIVYDLPQIAAKRFKKRFVVIFDEFQEINRFNGKEIEKALRAYIQNHTQVGYIFAGSKRSLLINMFTDKRRPFYRSSRLMPLGKIDNTHWKDFVKRLFIESKLDIKTSFIDDVLKITQGHPYYTQLAFYIVWNLYSEKEECSLSILEDEMLSYQDDDFINLWKNLTLSRQSLLVALSKEETSHPYAGDYILSHRLGSASNVQEAIRYLEREGIIEKSEGRFRIVDPLFCEWILKRVI